MWAFGVSRDGLALDHDMFWGLTMREYTALRRVYLAARGKLEDDPAYPLGRQSVDQKKGAMAAFVASHNARIKKKKPD